LRGEALAARLTCYAYLSDIQSSSMRISNPNEGQPWGRIAKRFSSREKRFVVLPMAFPLIRNI